jgi:pilus assembly protein CpaC
MGVAAGRTTVLATAEDGSPIAEYDVTIQPGSGVLSAAPAFPSVTPGGRQAATVSPVAVESAIRRSFRGMGGVHVTAAGPHTLVLSGQVANAADAQRAEAVARAYVAEQRDIVNNLALLSSIQVNVRVRVAEVSRQITRELGFNWLAFGQIGNFVLGLRTGGGANSVLGAITGAAAGTGSLSSSASRFALGARNNGGTLDVNAIIDALAEDQLITILAEPNLTAQSGETASFLAGGEFPVPVAANSNSNAITVEFKQFGVSLSFVPTVLSADRLNLRIRPEVSELSTQGAVTVPLASGTVTIPALTVRRAETTVELGSGQSFAIAGLLQRSTQQVDSGVLGLGEIPIIGPLFRSNQFQRNESELVIIVTPYLVRPTSDPRQLATPVDGFVPATDLDRVLYLRQLARGVAMPQLHSRPNAGFILE